MVAVALDWKRDPVAVAHKSIRVANGDVGKVLSAAELPDEIADLECDTVRAGSWAKFTGMVQDIWDSEIFVSSSQSGSSGLLVEDAAAYAEGDTKLSERLPVYLVSIPGATKWTKKERAAMQSSSSAAHAAQGSVKRAREEPSEGEMESEGTADKIAVERHGCLRQATEGRLSGFRTVLTRGYSWIKSTCPAFKGQCGSCEAVRQQFLG